MYVACVTTKIYFLVLIIYAHNIFNTFLVILLDLYHNTEVKNIDINIKLCIIFYSLVR